MNHIERRRALQGRTGIIARCNRHETVNVKPNVPKGYQTAHASHASRTPASMTASRNLSYAAPDVAAIQTARLDESTGLMAQGYANHVELHLASILQTPENADHAATCNPVRFDKRRVIRQARRRDM